MQVYKIFQEKQDLVKEGRASEAPFIVFSLALQPLLSLAHKLGEREAGSFVNTKSLINVNHFQAR